MHSAILKIAYENYLVLVRNKPHYFTYPVVHELFGNLNCLPDIAFEMQIFD